MARHVIAAHLHRAHARWLRGAVVAKVDHPEFHHHRGTDLLYRHPLIRYDVSPDAAVIAGLAEGALLLRGLPRFEELTLGNERHPVIEHRMETVRVNIGPTRRPVSYQVKTPYLALNQENHMSWEHGSPIERRRLLERVVVGNLLSLSKAVGLHVEERLRAEVDLETIGLHELKPGVRLLGFRGTFRVNFAVPDGWGIGKSSARGFGTLNRMEV
jgi:hypothetical protein